MSKLRTPSCRKKNGAQPTHLEWLKLFEKNKLLPNLRQREYEYELWGRVFGSRIPALKRQLKHIRNQRRYLKRHGQGKVAYALKPVSGTVFGGIFKGNTTRFK